MVYSRGSWHLMLRLLRNGLKFPYTLKDTHWVESAQRHEARFVCYDCTITEPAVSMPGVSRLRVT